MRIPAWERENFRLNKGNIVPSRKSLVSDIPAGEGKTAKPFFTVYLPREYHTVGPVVGNWDPPTLSPASECASPRNQGGGGVTQSPACEGVGGGPIRTTGEKKA